MNQICPVGFEPTAMLVCELFFFLLVLHFWILDFILFIKITISIFGFPEGPLHGIPYGLKDIIAVPKYKTTWGSRTFKDQVINTEAWVYKRYPCLNVNLQPLFFLRIVDS